MGRITLSLTLCNHPLPPHRPNLSTNSSYRAHGTLSYPSFHRLNNSLHIWALLLRLRMVLEPLLSKFWSISYHSRPLSGSKMTQSLHYIQHQASSKDPETHGKRSSTDQELLQDVILRVRDLPSRALFVTEAAERPCWLEEIWKFGGSGLSYKADSRASINHFRRLEQARNNPRTGVKGAGNRGTHP